MIYTYFHSFFLDIYIYNFIFTFIFYYHFFYSIRTMLKHQKEGFNNFVCIYIHAFVYLCIASSKIYENMLEGGSLAFIPNHQHSISIISVWFKITNVYDHKSNKKKRRVFIFSFVFFCFLELLSAYRILLHGWPPI